MTAALPPIAAVRGRSWQDQARPDGALPRGEIAGWHTERRDHVAGRRPMLGTATKERGRLGTEAVARAIGLPIAGSREVPHHDPRRLRRVSWVDREDI